MPAITAKILRSTAWAVFSLALFACDAGRNNDADGLQSISYWTGWTGTDLGVQQRLVDEFERTHPGKKVHLLSVAGAYQKVRIAFAGADAPDICSALWPEDLADFAAHGYLEPLDDELEAAGRSLDDWFPAAADMMTVGPHTYGISLTCNPFFVLYNRDLFNEAGMVDEGTPRTIDQLTTVARRLTKQADNGVISQLGMLTPNLVEWAPLFGGSFYDPVQHQVTADHAGNVRALRWINEVVSSAGAANVLAFEQGGGNMQSAINPFYNGQVAMFVSSIWEENFINRYAPELNYGYFPMPSLNGDRPDAAFVSGSVFVISKSSENKDLAWEFLNWLSSPEAAAEFCKSIGNMPAVREAAEDEAFVTPMFDFARELLKNPDSYTAPQMPFWTAYKTELTRAQEFVLHGRRDASDVLAEVQSRIQRQVDELMRMFAKQGVEPQI